MRQIFQNKIFINKKVFLAAAAIIMIGGFFVALPPTQAATPSTIYVDVNVAIPGDGTTLESAFKTIQGAKVQLMRLRLETRLMLRREHTTKILQ